MGTQLFARGVNLNWPIRAQIGTCSSRFQTAVDVDNGSRLFVLPYGRILFKFSTTKMVLWSPWRFCMMGNLSGFMEIWSYGDSLLPIVTRGCLVKLVRWEQLWEWSEIAGLQLRSKRGTTPMGKSPKTASNRPQTKHKTQWQPHLEVSYFYFNTSAHILPFWNIW